MEIERNVKLYKLTTSDFKTRKGEYNETLWGENVEHTAPGGKMCSEDVLHAYVSPELAVLLNPVHADISDYVLWECEGDVCARDGDLKVGCTRLRTLKQIKASQPTPAQLAVFAILCEKYNIPIKRFPQWHRWADAFVAGDPASHTEEAADNALNAVRSSGCFNEMEAATWAARAALAAPSARSGRAAARRAVLAVRATADNEAFDLVGTARQAFSIKF